MWRGSVIVFSMSLLFVWWLTGDRLILINDEGTFLSQAARIARGEVLYRDIFGLTGPLCYWLLAVLFKLFGISMQTAHSVLAAEMAALTTLVFLITKRLSDETSGFIAAFAFLAFNAADPGMMAINHRWDADTYAILGVYAIWRSRPALGGFLLALSFWATPVMGITALAGAGAAWLIGQPVLRVVAGGAAGALAGTAALWATGGLQGFIDGLLWARANYSGANRMAYGEVVGGYGALFGDAAGAELGFRALLVFGLTISAWLPVLSGLLILKSRDRNLLFLGVCGSSMILGMSPRFDIGHLIFAAPLFYPIAASFLQKARWTILPVGAVGALFLFSAVINRMGLVEVETPVGTVRTEAGAAELTRFLVANVKPGEKLFAYPYVPIVYFVTGARNVSRFAFLQPGFHTEQDERIAASDLLARPPDKVVFFDTPEGDLLRVWPASDRSRLKLRYLETFVGERYEPIARHGRFSVHGPKAEIRAGD